jgi:hypothetical protein
VGFLNSLVGGVDPQFAAGQKVPFSRIPLQGSSIAPLESRYLAKVTVCNKKMPWYLTLPVCCDQLPKHQDELAMLARDFQRAYGVYIPGSITRSTFRPGDWICFS